MPRFYLKPPGRSDSRGQSGDEARLDRRPRRSPARCLQVAPSKEGLTDPIDDIKHLRVAVGISDHADGAAMCDRLLACGVESFTVTQTIEGVLEACQEAEPDALILGFALDGAPSVQAIQTIRRGEKGVNAFLPIILTKSKATAKLVHAGMDAGAHEVLSLPASRDVIGRVLHRAVFVGRPFIRESSYIGPCRRRRQLDGFGAERRKAAWPGYVHAAHTTYID